MSTDDIFTQTNTTVPDTEATPYRTATEFRPLPTAEDYSDEPKKKTFSNDSDGLKEAAQSLTDAREAGRVAKVADDAPITERDYHWDAGRGDRVPDHFTLDAKRAAEDLSRVRLAEVEANSPAQELTSAIDQVREVWNQSAQPQQPVQPHPEVQATADAVQQQPQQPQDPANEIRQVLEQHPAVRQALEHELAQVEQHRAAYAQGLHQSATVAAASLLANFPELSQVPTAHLQSAIQAIAASNPARAAAIDAQLGRTQSLFNEFKNAQAAEQKIHAQRMQEYVRNEDARFEQHLANETPETKRAVLENGRRILQESYGVDATALHQAFQSSPALRSAEMQRMLFDLLKMKTAQESAAGKLDRSVPPVQRPGTARDNSGDDSAVERALAKFRSDPSPKTGSELLRARRAATRG